MEESEKAAEPWPLYNSWWLGVHSKLDPEHKGFDIIEITALGPRGFKKVISTVMVPKIDGLVCESHSFIGNLIKQNVDNEVKLYKQKIEKMKRIIDKEQPTCGECVEAKADGYTICGDCSCE